MVILFSYIADKIGDVSVAALTYSLMGAGYFGWNISSLGLSDDVFSLNHYHLQIYTHLALTAACLALAFPDNIYV